MKPHAQTVATAPETYKLMDCLHVLDPRTLEAEQTPGGKLLIRSPEKGEHRNVSVSPCFPITDWGRFIVFTDEDGTELGVLEDIRDLVGASRDAVARELDDQHFLPEITDILAITRDYHIPTWDVMTDRGPRTFTLKGRRSLQTMGSGRLYIRDAEGNGYLIPDVEKLDTVSRRLIDSNT